MHHLTDYVFASLSYVHAPDHEAFLWSGIIYCFVFQMKITCVNKTANEENIQE